MLVGALFVAFTIAVFALGCLRMAGMEREDGE